MVQIAINRVSGDYGFEATDAAGNVVKMDSNPESGGANYGARPMQLLLMGLGGCSGIDIVSILKKQRQPVEGFSMDIEGDRQKGTEPSLWENVRIVFKLKGKVDPEKARKAADLSMNKYCSVAETLRKSGTNVSWEVRIEE